jgi:hypothetical protein
MGGNAMRSALRALALASLGVCVLGLALDVSAYVKNPCPSRFFFQLFLVLAGGLTLLPSLLGSAVAAWLAAAHRQWVWLAGLPVASAASLVLLSAAAQDRPPAPVLALILDGASTLDHGLGLTTCGSQPSLYVQAAAVVIPLLVAPLVLFCYSCSSALSQAAPVAVARGQAARRQ